uniref:Uncharacterized protein n=1 Tax=Siphoviridae sp. ct96x5 TaxID=2825367 RepID=A0A8S5PSX0_9CAUD|nr:MAG TPA: hypothetical protein [Siphoviridae sp. ct96x5]
MEFGLARCPILSLILHFLEFDVKLFLLRKQVKTVA